MFEPAVRRTMIAAAHLAAIAVIGLGDYLTGPDYELRALYLLAVVSAAWFGGRTVGIVLAAAAIGALILANDQHSFDFARDALGASSPASAARSATIVLWNTASRFVTFVVVVLLVTHIRRQTDALREKTAQILRESTLREEYIGLFVHEMRHSAAATSLAVASLTSSPRLADDERAYLERLRTQAGDLEQLATQLLAIGRLESGSADRGREEVDLRELTEGVVASSPGAARIDLRVPGAPVRTLGDAEDLRRAIHNYVRNALTYSPATSRVTVEVRDRNGSVGVDVRDAGVGFDPKDARLLFRKYGRLRNPPGMRAEGAGLGLYLTRLIVESHGGTVGASSDGPGRGATFSMWLPRA